MKFDGTYSERQTLGDGSTVTLRLVTPADRDEFARQFARLSPSSRYRRFFVGRSELTDDMLDYLTIVDGTHHVAIVAFAESLDLKEEAGAGVARFVRRRDEPTVAEAAITVVDEYQGRGLGRLLLTRLAEAALERGIRTFRGEVLPSNEPMRKILEEAGSSGRDSGEGTLVYDIPIDAAAPNSPVRRVFSAAAASMVVWLSRLYPPGYPPDRS